MRLGNSTSLSYRRFHARHRAQRVRLEAHWCERLDALVERAESYQRGSKTRQSLLGRADKVREKLRKVAH